MLATVVNVGVRPRLLIVIGVMATISVYQIVRIPAMRREIGPLNDALSAT